MGGSGMFEGYPNFPVLRNDIVSPSGAAQPYVDKWIIPGAIGELVEYDIARGGSTGALLSYTNANGTSGIISATLYSDGRFTLGGANIQALGTGQRLELAPMEYQAVVENAAESSTDWGIFNVAFVGPADTALATSVEVVLNPHPEV